MNREDEVFTIEKIFLNNAFRLETDGFWEKAPNELKELLMVWAVDYYENYVHDSFDADTGKNDKKGFKTFCKDIYTKVKAGKSLTPKQQESFFSTLVNLNFRSSKFKGKTSLLEYLMLLWLHDHSYSDSAVKPYIEEKMFDLIKIFISRKIMNEGTTTYEL